jgi:apolipoprotein N-acyltransferase
MTPDSKISLSSLGISLFLCALSGVLLALSFPKVSLWFLAWFSMVPFLLAVFASQKSLPLRQTLYLGFAFGFFHFLVGLYWVDIVLEKYGGLPVWMSIPVLILLCGYLALYGVAFALGVRFFHDSMLLPLWLSLPSLWVVLEWLRGKLLTGFPWNLLAYSQGDVGWLRQIADITGAYGVSWLIVLVNVLLARAFMRRKDLIGWLCLVVALLASFWYGSKTLSSDFYCRDTDLKIVIVQGNIDQAQKWDEAFRDTTIEIYRQLSLEAARSYKLDLIVWPESAMPFFYGFSPDLTMRVDKIIDEAKVPVLFGSIGIAGFGKDAKSLNKAYLVEPGGFIVGDYAKEHLVPFGEYVPLQPFLFFVHKLVPTAGDFVPGRSSGVISWKDEAIGMLICYEAIFPELARNRVLHGANVIVNISNDAWFGKSSAPYQHLEIARWRAVETRRPIVRSTNTGISAFIDPFGNIVSTLGLFQSGVLVVSVKPCSAQTFYVRYGDVFVAFCALIMLLASLYSLAKVKIKKSA